MAHHIVIKKGAVFAKDGHILKGKYRYTVSCKRCGRLDDGKCTSSAQAELFKDGHHSDMSSEHQRTHPNDRAHIRAHQNKRKRSARMVKPRG